MRYLYCILSALAITACGSSKKAVQVVEPVTAMEEESLSKTTLIIMYDQAIGKEPLKKAIEEYKADIIYDYSIIPGMAVKIPEGADIMDAIKYFRQVKGVVSVERDHIYRLTDPVLPGLSKI